MDINEQIGKRIKEVRVEKRMSREQIARRLKVAQQTIEKYEKGKIEISVNRLIQISNVFDINILYFLQ